MVNASGDEEKNVRKLINICFFPTVPISSIEAFTTLRYSSLFWGVSTFLLEAETDQNRFCSELSPNAFWSKMCSNKIGPYLKMVNASGDEEKNV